MKYSYIPECEDKQEFVIRINKDKAKLKSCYKQLLPISTAKYNDLQHLCKHNAIPITQRIS